MRLVVFLALPLLLAADTKPVPDPAAVRGRQLAEATFRFQASVFAGKEFPSGSLSRAEQIADVLGRDPKVSLVFYAADLSRVTRPEKPGPYAVHITIEPTSGRKLVRFVTLYRTATEVPAGQRFDGDKPDDFARAMGPNVAVIKRHAEPLSKVLGKRTFGEWSRDPRAARLLAGLALSKPLEAPLHSYDDAWAVERQWWVDLKRRRIYAGEKYDSAPLVCPRPIEGKPSRVVRAGTEEEAGVKKGTAEKLDRVFQEFARDTDHPFAVCIVRKGVIVLHRAYGTRDGKPNPMTVNTPTWMASVTKTMSATLMLMLIDQGRVKLDDPVDKYLPALRGIDVKKPLTIHHLYTHTNGLTLDGYPGWSDELADVPERIAAYYDRLKVGQEWAYTGTGNTLGSKIFEMVTGTAIPQAYHKYLFGPLGCTGTQVTDTHAGAYSIPLDMAKFGQMLLNRGAYGKWRFFREETFEKMLPGKLDKLLGPGAKRTFGFGLDGQREAFGHGTASGAIFSIDTKRELVFIMTRNRYGKNQDRYNGQWWKVLHEGIGK